MFITLCAVPFIPPVNPGPSPVHPVAATQSQIHAINAIHVQAINDFKQYDTTDRALKQQLLGAVDDMFVNVLSDTHVGYANFTTL